MTDYERERLDRLAEAVVHQDTMLDVLAEAVKELAPQAQVDKIEALQHADHADIAVLKEQERTRQQSEQSGPSWAWINPFAWWSRAGEDSADRAIKVFRQIVAMAVLIWLLYEGVSLIKRNVEANERRAAALEASAEAAEVQAGKPPVQVVPPVVAVPLPDSLFSDEP